MTDRDKNASSLRRASGVSTLRTSSDFKFDFAARTSDYADFDVEIGKRAAGASASTEHVLVQQAPAGLHDDYSLSMDDEREELFKDAWFNIKEGDFATALELLRELLVLDPEHDEGMYLEAYCHYRLGGDGPMNALRLLQHLRYRPLESDLANRVRDLRAELRKNLTPAIVEEAKSTGRHGRAVVIPKLREFTGLVPEEGLPFVLLARALADAGQLREALAVALAGAAEAETDRDLTSDLAVHLALELRALPARTAVRQFRAGQPQDALRALAQVEPEWRHTLAIEDFEAHLNGCKNTRGQRFPEPALDGIRLKAFYRLTVESEVNEALDLLAAGQLAAGERRLTELLRIAPAYAWLNFLYAVVLYVQSKDLPTAAKAAEAAMRDPSLAQVARLRDAIRDMQDAKLVNPLVTELRAAVESVKEPAPERNVDPRMVALTAMGLGADPLIDLLRSARAKMAALQPRVAAAQRATVTEIGAQTVRQLDDILIRRIAQFDTAVLVRRFNQCTARLNAGAANLLPYSAGVGELRDIQAGAQRLSQQRSMDQEDRKLLSDILQALARIGL